MTPRRPLSVIAAICASALALGACSAISHLNPFHSRPKRLAEEAQSISLLQLNDQLRVSGTLEGQDFFLPPPQPQAEWPLPGGTPEQSVENVAAAPDFQIAWRRHFGDGSTRARHVIAPPIMADGKVFVMDGLANVSAHDARTGAQIWRVNLRPKAKRDKLGFGGGLAYADGKIYASSGYRLVARLDADTGRLEWETRTDAPIHAAPTVGDGRVYVVDVDDELLTFDTANGTPDWNYQALTEPARILAASSPALEGDTLVASFASGELVALRADNGTELWNESLSRTTRNNALSEIRDIAGRPVIYKGDVFAVSHADVMTDTNLRTGAVRWQLPVSAITSPWAAGDVVFVVDQTGEVVCISRDSGQLYWLTDLNEPAPRKGKKPGRRSRAIWSSPILASNRLITVSDKGEAVALDPKTGKVERRLKIGDDALIGPIAAGGLVYVATQRADLIAIR
ncbi:MAG TPA: PQQ-binding-like beta-propeller repeat protein [Caulobacteraceae bacterium]|nr:PQQ-binding-like beta-propeller repeat protein [Caulobacteraceae bacterium]